MWNRGCCDQQEGSSTCPTDGYDHVSNEYYEIWRTRYLLNKIILLVQIVCRCTEDYCNVYPPEGSVGNSAGGMLVTTLLLLPTVLMLTLTV